MRSCNHQTKPTIGNNSREKIKVTRVIVVKVEKIKTKWRRRRRRRRRQLFRIFVEKKIVLYATLSLSRYIGFVFLIDSRIVNENSFVFCESIDKSKSGNEFLQQKFIVTLKLFIKFRGVFCVF